MDSSSNTKGNQSNGANRFSLTDAPDADLKASENVRR